MIRGYSSDVIGHPLP